MVKKSGGAAPFGYRRVGMGFEPDPDEAPIRALIFELFLKHKRKLTVANILNKRGYRTRSGAKFSDTSIDRFLRDPITKGHHKENFADTNGVARYRKLLPESEWRFPVIDALVKEIDWNEANDLLLPKPKRTAKKSQAIFAKLVRCLCGSEMYHPQDRNHYFCKECDNRIETKILEQVFVRELAAFKIDRAELNKIALNKANLKSKKNEIRIIRNRIAELKKDIDRLLDLYMSKGISRSRFVEKNALLEQQLTSLLDEKEKMLLTNKTKFDNQTDISLSDYWITSSVSRKQRIARLMTDKITVSISSIKIRFSLSPSSF